MVAMLKFQCIVVLATLIAGAQARNVRSLNILGRRSLQNNAPAVTAAADAPKDAQGLPLQTGTEETEALLTDPNIPFPEPAKFDSAIGLGFVQGGSVSFKQLNGDCVSQSFGVTTGSTQVIGEAAAAVDGDVQSQSKCGENAKPFDIGFSGFGGFVATSSFNAQEECRSDTIGFGQTNTIALGDIKSSASGGVGGGSSCGKVTPEATTKASQTVRGR
ncbi:hypothetical protein BSKO_01133 [Bryopsis sp. KO-2023]|nr:hypothetical protein BSKO_01133 [Bryopsis sp. KO-2023]